MSVCIAWNRNGKSYLIADTLTSSSKNISLSSTTHFLQRKEPSNGRYVEEEGLKIYEISSDFAIAVAGDVPSYSEIVDWIYSLKECVSIHELLVLLQQNYQHLLENIEMILLYKEVGINKIMVWNGKRFYEHNDTSSPIFIGCGSENTKFTEAVKQAIAVNNDSDPDKYLALIVSFVQCLSMKLKTISFGFGGTFYGLFISSKLHWMRDLEYVLLAKNGTVAHSITVIIRKSSIVISSSMDNTTLLLTNHHLSRDWFDEYHNMKSIIRAVDTKEAFYYIFYGLKSNRIYLWEAKGILLNAYFRKWTRRDDKKVEYLYAIDSTFSQLITSGKSKKLEPQVSTLTIMNGTYLSFDKVCSDVVKQLKKVKVIDGYDFDFVTLDCTSFNKDHIKLIRQNIDEFYNIVVIDYDFFCQQIIQSNLEFYKDTELDLTTMNLELLFRHCLQYDFYVEYSKIKIIVVKTTDDYIINNVNITSWFQSYHNCSFIITDNKEKDLAELLIYWIKDYYINSIYFHLGMNVLIADNKLLGEILDILIPHKRRQQSATDWILVRMNNSETSMPGGFNYVSEDWAFINLLNLYSKYLPRPQIDISQCEQELITGIGNEHIHSWLENNSLFNNIILIDPTE